MRYSVFLEPISEPGLDGFYYAHVPSLGLTTHGKGVEGALAAAQDLAAAWVLEKRTHGESLPVEHTLLVGQIELPDAVHGT